MRLGSDSAASPAGAVWVQLEPERPPLHWRPAGGGAPTVAPLWPAPDASGLGELVTRLAPALLGQTALDLLRQLDDTAKPVIDAALDGFGLLDTAGDVRLPVRLRADPVGWLTHAGALAGDRPGWSACSTRSSRCSALTGGPGQLTLTPGVAVVVSDAGGAMQLRATVDTSAFGAPAATRWATWSRR